MRIFLLVLLFQQASFSYANPFVNGFTADYEVSKNGTVLGISHRQLIVRQQGKQLHYSSTTTPTGLVALFVSDRFIEHSRMLITPSAIKPVQYEYQRTGGNKEIIFNARFDWKNKQIILSNRNRPETLLPNSHDLLSFQLAMMRGLSRGQKQFSFQIVDHKRIQEQQLEFNSTQIMHSSLGPLDIIRLDHRAEKSHYRFSFWCAKQLHFLPIKITKIEQDGDAIQLKLTRFNSKVLYLKSPPD